ncbi:MAG: hypothetical protein P4M11_02740 [Candidatus Pacebacteria bacterium]|nr:hypothetical protein [Candidatus Paceibacterota bacterium]
MTIPRGKLKDVETAFVSELQGVETQGKLRDPPPQIPSTREKQGVMCQVLPFKFPYFHLDIEGEGGPMLAIELPDKFPENFAVVCTALRSE